MSTVNVFITGATGYIGGDALYALYKAHPDWKFTCLVRTSDKGALIAAQYPTIRLVYGDLSKADLLKKEAQAAEVVMQSYTEEIDLANADDLQAIKAITSGITSRSEPGFLIHMSGGGVLTFSDVDNKTYGKPSNKVWDDETHILELTTTTQQGKVTIPGHAPHRSVEEYIIDTAKSQENVLKAAIVAPPLIYGTGRGPGNKRSIQLPNLIKYSIQRKQVFVVEDGAAKWSNIHVHDLSSLLVILAEAAGVAKGTKGSWRYDQGYYLVENGQSSWADLSKAVAEKLHAKGLVDTVEVKSILAAEANQIRPFASIIWGTNCLCSAKKAKLRVGWEPKGAALLDTIDEAIEHETKQ